MKAAEAAVALAKKEKFDAPMKDSTGKIDLPSIFLELISVDKGNLMRRLSTTVFKNAKTFIREISLPNKFEPGSN